MLSIDEFEGKSKRTILSCYSPTNMSEETEVKNLYKDLKSVTENVPAHNFLVVAGHLAPN